VSREEEARFEAMVRSTRSAVLAYALRRTDAATAEEVAAETYAIAWRRFDAVPADPLPWLYAVARRVLANATRAKRRRAELVERLTWITPRGSAATVDPTDDLGEREIVRAALLRLRDADREILMLVAWEGLESARAAEALGISKEVFALRLHRARRRLDAALSDVERELGVDDNGEGSA
jgi:RNA polymerase sigma-70 factor (ECF subfamily)